MEPGKFLSTFPSWVGDDYPPLESRLAWCYGDLGMGVALWQAGKIAGNKEWEEEAVEILLKTTERREPKQNAIVDAGLCHGAAGNAHIYNRMYINTGNEAFKEAALYWLDLTLKMAVYEDGFAGYKVWHTEEYGGWQNENGFLEGIAGIGLAIFSFVSELEPKWDYSLYLS
ncbi:MAG: hypothetical protein GY757_55875 [bacterium]|nr:hypothetical protein [bacterium]